MATRNLKPAAFCPDGYADANATRAGGTEVGTASCVAPSRRTTNAEGDQGGGPLEQAIEPAQRLTEQRALLHFLQRDKRLSAGEVAQMEEFAKSERISVHEALERQGVISEKELATLLASTLRLSLIDLTSFPLDSQVVRALKESVAIKYEVVPIRMDTGTIEVATANPLDLDALKAVEFATGKRVQALVATRLEVRDALAHAYRLQESLEQFLNNVPTQASLTLTELHDVGGDLRSVVASDAELPPVVKLADLILLEGMKLGASDVHMEPAPDGIAVRYRIDGILEESFRFPKWVQNPLTARFKVMSKLDITERRVPQDGRMQLRYQDRLVDVRVSSLPAQHGEKITLRILDAAQAIQSIERIGLSPTDLGQMRAAVRRPDGMVLVTGPTGSGKTTTLYALLRDVFSPRISIVTIEDPIEYQLRGINQVAVNDKQGMTFANVLRSILRQDPNVILVGEIRDEETARIAFQAAQTGHLVLSTLHTNDAAATVTRLQDLGLEPHVIATGLKLVVAQRLVRNVCQLCSAPYTPPAESRRRLALTEGHGEFRCGAGCPPCRQSGYTGRTGIYELLPISPAIAKLIEVGGGESAIRQQARLEGCQTLLEDARDKLARGVTTAEEVLRVVQVSGANPRCPSCQQEIADDYAVCPHCSTVLHAVCAGCGKPLSADWSTCPHCSASVERGAGDGREHAAGEAPVAAREATAPPAYRRTYKALVADDDRDLCEIVRLALEKSDLGLSVITAADGTEALALAESERPDVVILDISMPGADGFEICRRLRADLRTAFVPVLMLTAHESVDFVSRGFAAGTDDYIIKPIRRDTLIARVRRMLERTYGKDAVIGRGRTAGTIAPTTDTVQARGAAETNDGAAPSAVAELGRRDGQIEVLGSMLAQFTANRDALVASVEQCRARIDELAARVEAAAVEAPRPGAGGAVTTGVELDDVRGDLEQLRVQLQRDIVDARADAMRACSTADEALRRTENGDRAPEQVAEKLADIQASLEHLRLDHTRLESAVEARLASVPQRAEGRALAASVEEWSTRLRDVSERVGDLAGRMGDVLRQVSDLGGRVAEIATRVEAEAASRSEGADLDSGARHVDAVRDDFEQLIELRRALVDARAEVMQARTMAGEALRRLETGDRAGEEQAKCLAEVQASLERMWSEQARLESGVEARLATLTPASDADALAGHIQVIRADLEGFRLEQQQAFAEQQAAFAELRQAVAEQQQAVSEHSRTLADEQAAFAELRQALAEQQQALTEHGRTLAEQQDRVAEARDGAAHASSIADRVLRAVHERVDEAAGARAAELAALEAAIDRLGAGQSEVRAALEDLRADQVRVESAVAARVETLVRSAEQESLVASVERCEERLAALAERLDAASRPSLAARGFAATLATLETLHSGLVGWLPWLGWMPLRRGRAACGSPDARS